MESCVPPGFRFHPTDEELVGYYLRKKIASQKIDLDVIRDIDLYRIEPWDLIERCRIGFEEQNEWYFFSHKDKKYPTGTRTNRATIAGFWKATGRDKAVFDKCKLIGMRKTLVFYTGRAPNGQKTDWIMHEYRLESDCKAPSQEEIWVVCRAFKKRATSQTKNTETWNSTFYNDHPNSAKSLFDPLLFDCIKRNDDHEQEPSSFLNHNLICKQEADQSENAITLFAQSDVHQFVQLPQLQSPTLPSLKRPTIYNYEEQNQQKRCKPSSVNDANNKMASTDWRDLDKFVASQLSQEEERSCDHQRAEAKYGKMSNFGGCYSPDHMELLLSSRDEYHEDGNKLNEWLNSESSRDIGIHIFDK